VHFCNLVRVQNEELQPIFRVQIEQRKKSDLCIFMSFKGDSNLLLVVIIVSQFTLHYIIVITFLNKHTEK